MLTLTVEQNLILALLREARDAGVGGLTTTAVIKYVYLADYFNAKHTDGATFTNLKWQFLHFGPYAPAAQLALEQLVDMSRVQEEQRGGTERDYYFYSLGEWSNALSLEALGVSQAVRLRITQALRDFKGNLNALLNFVYFHTEPMQEAQPEDYLDFSACLKDVYAELKPVQMRVLPNEKVVAFRKRIAELRQGKKPKSEIKWVGAFDDVYYGGLRELDGEELPANLPLTMRL